MTSDFTGSLHVVDLTDRGVQCVTAASTNTPFWLPRGPSHVRWASDPQVGQQISAIIPSWLARKHHQLASVNADYQRPLQQRNDIMADQRDMSGTLSKNDRKEKDAHPDYRGTLTIRGEKFRLSGWIKNSENGKFLSLAVRPADEDNGAPKRKSAPADAEIPF
jgi:hypothetical protein